jgi:N-methylhydantoinase B
MAATPESLARIGYQVMWNRLISVVEEQAQTLIRTAFGSATREAGDLSAGVYDTRGDMLAQAVTGTPGHVNSMALTVGHVLRKIPLAVMAEGDVFITNDPWLGTGHLNDLVVVTPVFRRGRAVAFFACTLHVTDIGGLGSPNAGRQVFEEGLRLPIVKLAGRSGVDPLLIEVIAANVREPLQAIGDIYAEIACNEAGASRLLAMMREFGMEDLDGLAAHIAHHSRAASLDAIRHLPFGTYRNSMTIDGLDAPIDLVAALTIGADGIAVDFAGTSPVVRAGINVPLCYTEAYTSFGVKCVVAPRVPNNTASLATIRVTAPSGCILNAPDPAPVAGRGAVGQMLPDVVFGCLQQAVAGGVPAEGTSCLWNLRLMGGAGRVDAPGAQLAGATPFNVMCFHSGGTGARPRQDGLSATAFPSGVRNVPVEVTESVAPVLIRHKEYRRDSGGIGAQRGGLGQVMVIESAEDKPFAIAMNFDRVRFPPRGRAGGGPGAAGKVRLRSGATLPSKGQVTIPAGDAVVVEMPGGGGYGDPRGRDPNSVVQDVAQGFVSLEAALHDYGVSTES